MHQCRDVAVINGVHRCSENPSTPCTAASPFCSSSFSYPNHPGKFRTMLCHQRTCQGLREGEYAHPWRSLLPVLSPPRGSRCLLPAVHRRVFALRALCPRQTQNGWNIPSVHQVGRHLHPLPRARRPRRTQISFSWALQAGGKFVS